MAYTRRYPQVAPRRSPVRVLVVVAFVFVLGVTIYRTMANAFASRSRELSTAHEALRQATEKAKAYERDLMDMETLKTSLSAHKMKVEEVRTELEETRAREREANERAEEAQREIAKARATVESVREKKLMDDLVRGKTGLGGEDEEVERAFGTESETRSQSEKMNTKDSMLAAASVNLMENDENSAESERTHGDEALTMATFSSKMTSDPVAEHVEVKVMDSATGSDPLLRNLAAPPPTALRDMVMKCNGKVNTEYWGGVVKDGSTNSQPDAAACCDSCAKMNANGANKCSVWVYGTTNKQCWLKYEADPTLMKPQSEGPHVQWTSGYFILPKDSSTPRYAKATGKTNVPHCLHTVMTSNGNVYMNWQSRVMYSSYLKHAGSEGSIMKAFTRVLHKGRNDELMHEIPTMRFNPVQSKCDGWCDYPVADRSQAVALWLETADSERCSHVVMVETDHIIVKSPSPEILLPLGQAMGFQFGYINPSQRTLMKLFPQYFENGQQMPPTGNAPTVVNTVDLRRIAPMWAKFVNQTEQPAEVRKELGWVRDMYAYALAAMATGVEHKLAVNPESLLMAQPPADYQLGDAYILHYTWGSEIYDSNEKFIWKWDKRSYADGQYGEGPYILSEIPLPPEWDEKAGLQLQTFFQPRALTPSRLGLIKLLITEFNDAVRILPKVPKGYKTIEEARLDV